MSIIQFSMIIQGTLDAEETQSPEGERGFEVKLLGAKGTTIGTQLLVPHDDMELSKDLVQGLAATGARLAVMEMARKYALGGTMKRSDQPSIDELINSPGGDA